MAPSVEPDDPLSHAHERIPDAWLLPVSLRARAQAMQQNHWGPGALFLVVQPRPIEAGELGHRFSFLNSARLRPSHTPKCPGHRPSRHVRSRLRLVPEVGGAVGAKMNRPGVSHRSARPNP